MYLRESVYNGYIPFDVVFHSFCPRSAGLMERPVAGKIVPSMLNDVYIATLDVETSYCMEAVSYTHLNILFFPYFYLHYFE